MGLFLLDTFFEILRFTISTNLSVKIISVVLLAVVSVSCQTMNPFSLPRILESHSLLPKVLHVVVAEETTVARLFYPAPAWWAFASATDRPNSVDRLTYFRLC